MRQLSVADYFVEFLIANNVTDVFGYQGGMIAYIFDSLGKYRDKIKYNSCATEQGAALAACGYAQVTHKLGVAISTSGPGFTNMITGIANAWCDSVPVLFVSGNVNTKDKKRDRNVRQFGFQEIQSISIAESITKQTYEVELNQDYKRIFENAYTIAMSGRKGPVFIDLPINICREQVNVEAINRTDIKENIQLYQDSDEIFDNILNNLFFSKKPIIIAGAGIKQENLVNEFRQVINILQVPVVSTLPAVDIISSDSEYMLGYIGGTSRRESGIALQNADFVLTVGTRLCSKQIGHNMDLFVPKAKKIYRVDIDKGELARKVKDEETQIQMDLKYFLRGFLSYLKKKEYLPRHLEWKSRCHEMCIALEKFDMTMGNLIVKHITNYLPDDANIVLDVGKNLTYCGQSAIIKEHTRLYMSAGLGTMGYALPAAIGIYYGNRKSTYVIMGDGGAQMNIQELNTIVKNKLPITIIVLNNKALGNIRIFQEQYLESRYVATSEKEGDYFSCDFQKIGESYGMTSKSVNIEMNTINNICIGEQGMTEIIYDDCKVLPGIVAGGNYLGKNMGLNSETITKIRNLMDF